MANSVFGSHGTAVGDINCMHDCSAFCGKTQACFPIHDRQHGRYAWHRRSIGGNVRIHRVGWSVGAKYSGWNGAIDLGYAFPDSKNEQHSITISVIGRITKCLIRDLFTSVQVLIPIGCKYSTH